MKINHNLRMSYVVAQCVHRSASRVFWRKPTSILRLRFGSGDSGPLPPCPCPPPVPEPPPSDPTPPPCPKLPPPCPPPLCPNTPDPGNPCNYCPPSCIDPDYPDISRLKRKQCKFQQDDGIPVYLKGGQFDVVLYQATLVMTLLFVVFSIYLVFAKSGRSC